MAFGLLACIFKELERNECPGAKPFTNLKTMVKCAANMTINTLCEANEGKLPDGNYNWNIDNCGHYDVFRCTKGNVTKLSIYIIYL